MLKKILLFNTLIMASTSMLFAQTTTTTDTSYTIHSAYKKAKKKYPSISIAKGTTSKDVKAFLNVPYTIYGNDTLKLDAFINTKGTKKPAVILVHGGAWKSGTKELLNPLATTIAANGFSCFSINYRLAPEHQYPKAVLDVFKALSFIKQNASNYHIDTNKIAILGSSSGAQVASLVATTGQSKLYLDQPMALQALINIDGILAFSHLKSEEGTLAASWLGATEANNPELWKQASALSHVDKNCPPTLFIPSDFERFQAGRDEMIAILKEHNIYYKISPVHNAPHTFWLFNPWFDNVSDSIINFLNFIFLKT